MLLSHDYDFILWIFIGNYVLLNLFLAILLDSFLSEAEEEPDPEEILRAVEAARQKLIKYLHITRSSSIFWIIDE